LGFRLVLIFKIATINVARIGKFSVFADSGYMVINLEENFKFNSGRLYDELVLINELEVIAEASAEAVLEA